MPNPFIEHPLYQLLRSLYDLDSTVGNKTLPISEDYSPTRWRHNPENPDPAATQLFKALKLGGSGNQFEVSVSTTNVTPSFDEDKQALADLFSNGPIDEILYYFFLRQVESAEYPDPGDLFVNTKWSLFLQFINNVHSSEGAIPIDGVIPYFGINDHKRERGERTAAISFGMMYVDLRLFQHIFSAKTLFKTTALDQSKLHITMPYFWNSEENYRGNGVIEIEVLPNAVQIFFKKRTGNSPLFTGSYSINLQDDSPQALEKSEWSSVFDNPFSNEGFAQVPAFETIEDFLTSLITMAADYAHAMLTAAFALQLINNE